MAKKTTIKQLCEENGIKAEKKTKKAPSTKKKIEKIGTDIGDEKSYTVPEPGMELSFKQVDDIIEFLKKNIPSGKFAIVFINGDNSSVCVSAESSNMENVYMVEVLKQTVRQINGGPLSTKNI